MNLKKSLFASAAVAVLALTSLHASAQTDPKVGGAEMYPSKTIVENGQKIVEFSSFEFDEVTICPDPAITETTISVVTDNESDEADQLSKLNKNNQRAEYARLETIKLSLLTL